MLSHLTCRDVCTPARFGYLGTMALAILALIASIRGSGPIASLVHDQPWTVLVLTPFMIAIMSAGAVSALFMWLELHEASVHRQRRRTAEAALSRRWISCGMPE